MARILVFFRLLALAVLPAMFVFSGQPAVFALTVQPAQAADFDAGVVAFLEGDYAAALAHWQPLADEGHAGAQFNLGAMYRDGRGVPQDLGEAAWWFTKSARTGHMRAQYGLGLMYAQGVAVPGDVHEAAKWYGSAADQGHAQAQYALAILLAKGKGVNQDIVSAAKWLRLAADAGVEAAAAARALLVADMPPHAVEDADRLARNWSPRKGLAEESAR